MNRTVLIILGIAAAGMGYLFLKKRTAVVPAPQKALPEPKPADKVATTLAEKLKKETEEYKETLTSKIRSWT